VRPTINLTRVCAVIARSPRVALVALLAVTYFTTAKLGLSLGAVSGFATPVWPPTGIGLAALLLFGVRLWPGIWLGAFLVNWWMDAPVWVACGMATGNTLEVLLGTYLLRRSDGFHLSLDRIRDVLALVFLAALLSTTVSATLGVTSLWLGGLVATHAAGFTWLAWWIGDALGALVVAPLLLTWATKSNRSINAWRFIEATALMVLLVGASLVVFRGWDNSLGFAARTVPYVLFPFAVWAALRFGQRGAVTSTFIISVIAIDGTMLGFGAFAGATLSEQLLLLQTFIGIMALTSMTLAATLAERDAAIGAREDFISIASHELKTPISAIKLQANLLERDLQQNSGDGIDRSRVYKMLEVSNRQLDRINRLVDDMLDAARITTGRFSIEPKHMNLTALVQEVLEKFSHDLDTAKCAIQTNLDPAVEGTWDRARLEQVLNNLLINAIKYAPGKPLLVELKQDNERATLTVRDHGHGIPSEFQESIFQRLDRSAYAARGSGLGLGLFISKQIVDAHGGKMWVESKDDEGSAFIAELPKATRRGRPL
jgi:signal transduction histidine kinase